MDSEIESRLKVILRNVRSSPLDAMLKEHDQLEQDVAARTGGSAHLCRIRTSRLTLLILFRRPLDECIPTADSILNDPEASSSDVLSAIGTFATHCDDMGDRPTGGRFLERALERAQTTGGRSDLIATYSRLLRELRGE